MTNQDKQMREFGYKYKVFVLKNNAEIVKKYTRYFISNLKAQSYLNELNMQFKQKRYELIKELYRKSYKVKMLNLK